MCHRESELRLRLELHFQLLGLKQEPSQLPPHPSRVSTVMELMRSRVPESYELPSILVHSQLCSLLKLQAACPSLTRQQSLKIKYWLFQEQPMIITNTCRAHSARRCSKDFKDTSSCHLYSMPYEADTRTIIPPFTDDKTEAQKGHLTPPRPQGPQG